MMNDELETVFYSSFITHHSSFIFLCLLTTNVQRGLHHRQTRARSRRRRATLRAELHLRRLLLLHLRRDAVGGGATSPAATRSTWPSSPRSAHSCCCCSSSS